jgi:cobalamin biosynthesis protein CbiD
MPIKKKTTAAKKPAVLGPKAKLMKLAGSYFAKQSKKARRI